jgi:[ribosomal protein S18]-alanine N-acetyltransferase
MATEPTSPSIVVSLAPMGWADLPSVVAIDASASPHPWSEATFLAELTRDDRRYLVARTTRRNAPRAGSSPTFGSPVDPGEQTVELVGFVGVALFPEEAHVMTVAVAPAVQGRGIGARLIAEMLDVVARAGRDAVTLEVRASNGAARRLYGRAGFDEAGVRPAYYPDGEDAVIMWRRRGVEVS